MVLEFLAEVGILRSEDHLITAATENIPTLVLLGNYKSNLALVNMMLGRPVLPECLPHSPAGWRHLRISYGVHKGYSLSVADNFEVVDPVLANIAEKENNEMHGRLLMVQCNAFRI